MSSVACVLQRNIIKFAVEGTNIKLKQSQRCE